MKNFLVSFFFGMILFSCNKKENKWNISTEKLNSKLEVIDIRKEYYSSMSLDEFRQKYPFYLSDSTADEVYEQQRKDPAELKINEEITKKLSLVDLNQELETLFEHIQYYFPKFIAPKVYLTNSMFSDDILFNPVFYQVETNSVFIACDYFLGNGNIFYNNKEINLDKYVQRSMNPENIVPKVAFAISENILPFDKSKKGFLNYIVYYGKMMTLQDAFLPETSDEWKIGYTKEEIEWCRTNEYNMWNYFIKNDYLFSDNEDLLKRFIYPAPFSKFFTFDEDNKSVDLDSPGQAGIWLGWQIMRSYFQNNSDVKLEKVLANTDFQEIFNQAKYKPER